MKKLPVRGRSLALLVGIVSLLVLFFYVALRSGPLAPVAVTVANVESKTITPALFGIGTVEARYIYKIGPTLTGRVKHLNVQVGDLVKAGQKLGEMESVDLNDRIRSQESAIKRVEAAFLEAKARQAYAQTQAQRYEQLFAMRATSEENLNTKQLELQIADAALTAAQEEIARIRFDKEGLVEQRNNLDLIASVDGLVTLRHVDPGTTVVAGQTVVEVIDPMSLWINVRFDQINAGGLSAGLSARIVLRSRDLQVLEGHVLRVEPKADSVTEETLAKVVFDINPQLLPPIGELAEVTVDLPTLPATPIVPNSAIRRKDNKAIVWQIVEGSLRATPVILGASDLDGHVQILEGLEDGNQVVIYSEKTLAARSRIHVVEHIPGVSR